MSVPDFIRADDVKAFWLYMAGTCRGGMPPNAAQFDLMDVYRLAPNITTLDVEKPSGKLKVRFNGTAAVTLFAREVTGRFKDDLNLGPHSEKLIDTYKRTVSECRPYWILANVELQAEHDANVTGERVFDYERLAFPLVDAKGEAVSVVAILIRHPIGTARDGFECTALDFPSAADTEKAVYS